jgi:dCTP deaminase
MLIVGDNLKSLVEQYHIVNNPRRYDTNSLTLTLDRGLIFLEPDTPQAEVIYGHSIPQEWIKEVDIQDDGIVLQPKSSVLGCSSEIINMPRGYFGFLQTKGSLARLFVLINYCDGQVEAGYSGKITFEICNMANFAVRLYRNQEVGQLFIFKTSTTYVEPYHGRYQNAQKPTIQIPED